MSDWNFRAKAEFAIIGGPNGCGKTTFAKTFLSSYPAEFLNADEIADQLFADDSLRLRVSAGKALLKRAKYLIGEGRSFTLETTLSGLYLQSLMRRATASGFTTSIVYIMLESERLALKRIEQRVRMGGHTIPAGDVVRRFHRSKNRFWSQYRFLADRWFLYDNSGGQFKEIALGKGNDYIILDEEVFRSFGSTTEING